MEATSISADELYQGLQQGDPAAQSQIWDEYYPMLVRAAKRKLAGFPRRAFDEEDVALAALQEFLETVQAGKIYPWRSTKELDRLLMVITHRKAFAMRRREMRAKRGSGAVRGDSAFQLRFGQGSQTSARRHEPSDQRPSPRTSFLNEEREKQLIDTLPDDFLREIAQLRLIGHTNDEIADMLGCVRRTVERKVQRIRVLLTRVAESSAPA